jgi:diguanylate cyclase (GGDEF)-like protein/PAS domain S-box-containing protein
MTTSMRQTFLRARTWADSPTGTLLVVAIMFAATAAWRFADNDLLDAIGILYTVPIALLAVRFGTRAGVAGVVVAVGITLVWGAMHSPAHLEPTGYMTRLVALCVVAAIVGRQMQQRARVERQAERWFSLSDDLCCVAGFDGYFTRVNESWTRHLGYTESELLQRPYLDLCHPDDVDRMRAEMAGLSGEPRMTVGFEARWRAQDGSWHWLLWSARSDGGSIYAAARDITERKQLEQTLETLATEDALTGLPNRRAWNERFVEALARAARSGESLSVAMLDVDKLKELNDSEGHAAGDRLLKETAGAWRWALRDVDYLGRLGGDEFAAILPGCGPGDRATVIERLQAAMPEGQFVSVGVATWDGLESAQELLKRADDLLYGAKGARAAGVSADGAGRQKLSEA